MLLLCPCRAGPDHFCLALTIAREIGLYLEGGRNVVDAPPAVPTSAMFDHCGLAPLASIPSSRPPAQELSLSLRNYPPVLVHVTLSAQRFQVVQIVPRLRHASSLAVFVMHHQRGVRATPNTLVLVALERRRTKTGNMPLLPLNFLAIGAANELDIPCVLKPCDALSVRRSVSPQIAKTTPAFAEHLALVAPTLNARTVVS